VSLEDSGENQAIAAALMGTVTIATCKDPTVLMTHLESFDGKEAVDCLLSLGYASSRVSAVKLGQALMRDGIFRNVIKLDQHFTDDN
jgi:Domain found in Dishevelled, Egl-10, and Pleckstrin (DEP)